MRGSVPFHTLAMFPRCAYTISQAQTTDATRSAVEFVTNHKYTAMVTAAESEPTETILLNQTTTRKITAAHKTAAGANARNTPAPVATPLPPRNPSQTGKIWPNSAAIAAADKIRLTAVGCRSFSRLSATTTATNPFNASNINVNTPAALPARRETFVAPVPPEPVSRTSPRPVARTIKYPNGIDPIKYAIMTASTSRN